MDHAAGFTVLNQYGADAAQAEARFARQRLVSEQRAQQDAEQATTLIVAAQRKASRRGRWPRFPRSPRIAI
ncbi:hypothetical protein [Agromyces allii]|uniref:Uncharacterized protein n=1 Tax=Agromyces allii TaxID=393607 RepID=A0ABN2QR24_9MICO|nr:hypothetical protein [Agromyces allii]